MHLKQDLTRARTTAPESSRGGDLGDWLEARPNPLAIRMRLRSNGIGLTLEPPALAVALPNVSGRGMGGLVARSALHQAEQNARLGEVRSAGITDLRFGSCSTVSGRARIGSPPARTTAARCRCRQAFRPASSAPWQA